MHEIYQKRNELDKIYNELLKTIFQLLYELGVKKFDFKYPIEYISFRDKEHEKKKIVSVSANAFFGNFSDFAHIIYFTTEDNNVLGLSDLDCMEAGFLLVDIIYTLNAYKRSSKRANKVVHFENKDIIITDPCYIVKKQQYKEDSDELKQIKKELYDLMNSKDEYNLVKQNGWKPQDLTIQQMMDAYSKQKEYDELFSVLQKKEEELQAKEIVENDWSKCNYGDDMPVLGINNYICRNTIYGDWSCTTFNTDTNEPIGEFCADAGMVAVFDLEEVLKYNPDFDYHINRPWTTTLIKNFTGDVWFDVEHTEGIYEDTTKYHKKGDKWENDSVHVIGKGNVNFKTTQTGL